jgi:hypothetical protein
MTLTDLMRLAIVAAFSANCLSLLACKASPESGLQAYYPLDGNANDASGNDLNGTLVGNARFAPGKVGQAVLLAGGDVDSHIRIPSNTRLSLSKTFSLCAWVNPTSSVRSILPIVTKGVHKEDYTLWLTQSGVDLLLNWGQPDEFWPHLENSPPSPDVTPGRWLHVAVTADGQKIRYYHNGHQVRTFDFGKTIANSGEDFIIGTSFPGAVERFAGLIDEVRVYHRTLTPAELLKLAGQ